MSQINVKIEFVQDKIKELEKWRNMEKSIPSSPLAIKYYDIRLHTVAMNQCQELASMFEEEDRQSIAGMMDVYEKSIYDVQRYLQWPEINFRDERPISFAFFQEIKDKYKMIKVEVHVKEVISKDYIQEFLVKSSMEF